MHSDLEEALPMTDPKNPSVTSQTMVTDRWKLVYWSFVLFGCGAILPWNVFINAEAYFTKYKLADEPEYAKNYLAYVGVCAQLPNLVLSFVSCLFSAGGNLVKRSAIMLTLMGTVFTVTSVLPSVDTSEWSFGFFVLTMLSVVLTSSGTGILQNVLYGIATDFPMTYSNAIVLGSNVSGTLMSVLFIISLLISPGYQAAATVYFALALTVICLCLITLALLLRNRYFCVMHYNKKAMKTTKAAWISFYNTTLRTMRDFCSVMMEIKMQLFNIFFVFFVSLTIFPTMMASVKVVNDAFPLEEKYFTAVACFLSFNVFALLGNVVSNWFQFPSAEKLWIPIVLRALFIPFFLLCNMQPDHRTLPVYITSDAAFIVMGILMAFSGGYFASITMMYIPKLVLPEKARSAGMLGAFFLVFGILCGVNFVLFINHINDNWGPCIAGYTVNATGPVC